MLTTFSRQVEIERWLKNLNCSARSFVGIARLLGVPVTESTLSEYLRDIQKLGKETEDKVIDVLDKMRELQTAVYSATDSAGNRVGFIEVDWSRSEKVANAITARQLAMIGQDTGFDPDKQFQVLAERATRQTI